MNRRQLLMGALAAAALTQAPLALAWLPSSQRRALLTRAWQRAVERGCPLLVIVVPREFPSMVHMRELGAWLHQGTDADLAPLAGLELVCASLDEVDRLVPGTAAAEGATFLLLRVDQVAPTFRSIVVDPEAVAHAGANGALTRQALQRVLVREGLVPSRGVARLAAEARVRWVEQPPPGATWGVRDPCPMCGMGHYDAKDRTFLDLVSRPEAAP